MIDKVELTDIDTLVFDKSKEGFTNKFASVEEVSKAIDFARETNSPVDNIAALITQYRK